jgi:FimV-like protein
MPALRTIALVVMAVCGTAHAAGLGPVRVQSALGQALRASVPVLGSDVSELTASCIRVRLEQPDGAFLMGVQAAVTRSGESASILLSTRQSVNEPAVTLNLQVACGGSVQRSYQLLLDPVVSLPHLQQLEQQSSAIGSNTKNKLREQAMVAPAEEGVALAPSRRIAPPKTRSGDQMTAAPQSHATQPARKPAPTPRQDARKVTRSVLKLSGDDVTIDTGATFSPGLKLSDTLSESRDTGDAQSAAELKKAYDRFSAVMRDEDPAQNSEKQMRDMQAKLQELEKQTALLKEQSEKQHQADQTALASAKSHSISSGWLVTLVGLLVAALAAIGWLYRRVKELGADQSAALWEKTILGQETETGGWDNTLGVDDTYVGTEGATGIVLSEDKPSDWERGVPLDDTLAVDWAAQQATVQATTMQRPSTREASGEREEDAVAAARSSSVKQASSLAQMTAPVVAQSMAATNHTSSKPVTGNHLVGAGTKHDAPMISMEVEEISDLMQEAEFWMLLNDPERAIEMLEPCLNFERPVSPVPWVYLLDLYRVTGQQKNYQSLAARIKKVFNTNAPAWDEQQDSAVSAHSLRDYPHVVEMIEDLWEGDDIIPYLESLLLDEREGERAGFDLAVYREIIHLIGVARNPKTPRSREQLNFDDSQPRLISQKVSMPPVKAGKAEVPIISDEEADVFDRATAKQIITKQVTAKSLAKAVTAEQEQEPTFPKLPVADMQFEAQPQRQAEVMTKMPAVSTAAFESAPKAPESQQVELSMPAAKSPSETNAGIADVAVAVPPAAQAEDAERVADMARKLDLVLAYQEIGEHVGARVLLEEVIQGGTPLQVEKAKAMLKKLLREIDWQ